MVTTLQVARLAVSLVAATEEFKKGLGRATKLAEGWGKDIQKVGKYAMGGIAAGAAGAAAAVTGVGVALGKMAMEAAPLQGIESAFETITERSGQSADAMIAALEKSSAGMVAQRDLMKSYNQAASLVGDQFANRLPDAMGVLTKAAAATGQDMDYMMDSLVRGVGRVSPLILDNLGVQMDMNAALEDYAKKHGIAAAKTTVDHSEAMADLKQKLGFAQREMGDLEQAYHDANAEFIHAQSYWAEGSVELNKFQARVDKAKLAMDKKSASIAKMQEKLQGLQAEHGSTAEGAQDLTKVLTKEQQQMALFEQVVGKLEKQYEDMPDVQDSVATSMAALRAKMQNFKDTVGKAVLPILGKFMGKAAELADKIMPVIIELVETRLVPLLNTLAEIFGVVFDSVLDGTFSMKTLTDLMDRFLPPEIVDRIYEFAAQIRNLIDTVRPYIEQAVAWVAQHVELKDVLIALGIAIAAVVVPAVASIVATAAGVAAAIAGLIAIIAAVRTAWETDWMGIRTALTEFWENSAKPAFSQMVEWLQVNVPIAMQTVSDFWNNTLQPAFAQMVEWLQINVPLAVEVLSIYWNEILWPALQTVWAFIQEYVIPIFTALAELFAAVVVAETRYLAAMWTNVLWPALQKVWAFIQDNVIPVFDALVTQVKERVGPTLLWLKEKVIDKLQEAFKKMKKAIKDLIQFFEDLAESIRNVKVPGGLLGKSPSPFERSLRGISRAIQLEVVPAMKDLSMAAAMSPVTNYYFDQTVNTAATADVTVQSFESMRAIYG